MDPEGGSFYNNDHLTVHYPSESTDSEAETWSSWVIYWMCIKTEAAVSGRGRERLKAGLHRSQILFPGGQRVMQLLPLLFAKGAVCAVAKGSETEANRISMGRFSNTYYYCLPS